MKNQNNELATKPMLKAELKAEFKKRFAAFEKRFEKKINKRFAKVDKDFEWLGGLILTEFEKFDKRFTGIEKDLAEVKDNTAVNKADLDQNAVEHGQMKERLDGHDKLIKANQEDLDLLIAKG